MGGRRRLRLEEISVAPCVQDPAENPDESGSPDRLAIRKCQAEDRQSVARHVSRVLTNRQERIMGSGKGGLRADRRSSREPATLTETQNEKRLDRKSTRLNSSHMSISY